MRDYANPVDLLWEFTVCQGAPRHLLQLLKRSLRFSYGHYYIELDSPTALHVTRMNVMRKANNEHSPAMIKVMNRIKYAFGHGPLARKIEEI